MGIRSRMFAALVATAALFASFISIQPAAADVDVYTTPGQHTVNGRQWRTWCEPYSRTARCHTDILATTVLTSRGRYYVANWWTFNNLTYLSSPRSLWAGNPLATPGDHTVDGRKWRTECDTAKTGRNGCRASIWAEQVVPHRSASGYTFKKEWSWVFNNIVKFGPLRSDLAELVKWRPPKGTPPAPPASPAPPAPPSAPTGKYDMRRGPNWTNKVTLTFDDCPRSLSSFKSTVLAAEQLGIGLVMLPTGNCIRSGKFDASFARAHGHYVFNHSISHPDLTKLSYAGVLRELGAPGVVTSYGRPPYGAWNSTVQSAYHAKGMKIWIWNIDTNDWKGKSQSTVVNIVTSQAKPGNSVLMHMQWNAFNGPALSAMKSGLAKRGIGVCRNYGRTTPVAPAALSC